MGVGVSLGLNNGAPAQNGEDTCSAKFRAFELFASRSAGGTLGSSGSSGSMGSFGLCGLIGSAGGAEVGGVRRDEDCGGAASAN